VAASPPTSMHLLDNPFLRNPAPMYSHLWSVATPGLLNPDVSHSLSCNSKKLVVPGFPTTSIHLLDNLGSSVDVMLNFKGKFGIYL
jgi:hypothetical protein